ncbi:MAG: beta-N-acetylhexosaminidase [Thermoleophilaceae bacterium]|nr:beta-N-acetylhexosaminidase [Thermoleophilaceae bacterium]
MRAFIASVALVCVVAGASARAGESAPPSAVPLRVQVGQLIATGFPGTSAPAWLRDRLAKRELGGVILFGYNVRSREQVRALDAQLQKAARGDALIALDQEGGQVRRFTWASPQRDGSQQSTTHIAYRSAQAAAHDLSAAGANVNLAPVADVALGASSEMRRRAFPGSAANVSKLLTAALRGYKGTGVAPTVKHFPGFGAARANTDDATVRITRTKAQMESTELSPFKAAIAADVPIVMVAHALFPAYDSKHIASQSTAILQTLLRDQLAFEGVVVTDSMEARAVLARSSVQEAAERSIHAGADVVLLSGSGSYLPVYNRLLARARSDEAFRARVAQAYTRVRALKDSLRK